MKTRIREILNQETDLLEVFLGALSLVWGLHVLNPRLNTFDLPHYHDMSVLASEPVWGAAFALLGLLRVVTVLTDAATLRVRKHQAFVGALAWMFLALMIFRAEPRTPSSFIYATIATASIGVYLRLPEGRALWRYFKPQRD
jgi:hypothetical protein